jgi:UDP-N-acetyl-D-galactosamine dehydrogenase
MNLIQLKESKIGVIGLGYVGLPLAVEFAKKYAVVGYDINEARVTELLEGKDNTREIGRDLLESVLKISVDTRPFGLLPSSSKSDLGDCNIFIVTVPTPTDKYNRPVLTPMLKASETIGSFLKKGDIVIYESTVYPGVTEDECVPVLEQVSGLIYNQDFYVGYSPERINPGDKEHTVSKILKVTSGSTPEIAEIIDQLYKSIITAGTYKASSIRVAEAAKVIENSQRDINIAFVNELSKIFGLLGIDTHEVLEAAATKWNFLNFKPGLVGGHCIGVDPYYLAQKAQEVGYNPEIILAGRRMNDSMGKHVSTELIKLMMRRNMKVMECQVLILGFTFKENCPDIRNTRVIDIYNELRSFDIKIDIYDPLADPQEVLSEYGLNILPVMPQPQFNKYAAVVFAVSHKAFEDLVFEKSEGLIVYDVKGVLPKHKVDARL